MLAGKIGAWGHADGTGQAAGFTNPRSMALAPDGSLIVHDLGWLRKVTPAGVVTSIAGRGRDEARAQSGLTADPDAPIPDEAAVAVDGRGNVYLADVHFHRLERVTPEGAITTIAGDVTPGFVDGMTGPTGPARLNGPDGLAIDDAGNLYVADMHNHAIRKVTPDGLMTTLAGNGTAGFADGSGGRNGTARFSSPTGLAVDASGTLYVADLMNDSIRKIAPDGTTTTLAGNGKTGFADGRGRSAQLNGPQFVALDDEGNVIVSDTRNHRIRMIAPDGTTTTVLGTGKQGGTLGDVKTTELSFPGGVAADTQGNVYVAGDRAIVVMRRR